MEKLNYKNKLKEDKPH